MLTRVLIDGSCYLRFMAFAYIPLALMFTIGGVIRGAGDAMATMVLTLLSLWLVHVPLAKHLSSLAGLGASGIWLAMAISTVAGFFMHLIYYRAGAGKQRW